MRGEGLNIFEEVAETDVGDLEAEQKMAAHRVPDLFIVARIESLEWTLDNRLQPAPLRNPG
jgi:hypothetical protein